VSLLEAIEVLTGPAPTGSVIWMHGLGADGHDFEPIVADLVQPGERALRFLFPHAPLRPVTINGGLTMRAWYDIVGIGPHAQEDMVGLRAAQLSIEALIARESQRGIAPGRVVLAGFSQGGAVALYAGTRHRERLAGLLGLSCYLPAPGALAREHAPASLTTPIFLAHGTEDPLVLAVYGEQSRALLEQNGYSVEWHLYPMQHAVCDREITAVATWLRRVLD
jgi:phospholipase/carboxylesterase